MQSRWIIGWPGLLAALPSAAAARCGSAYNQAPTLAYWWLDGYVDFDDRAGAARCARRSTDWFDWHRATQLPDYAGLLAQAQRRCWSRRRRRRSCAAGTTRCASASTPRSTQARAGARRRWCSRSRPSSCGTSSSATARTTTNFRDDFLQADAGRALRRRAIKRTARARRDALRPARRRAARTPDRRWLAASPFDARALAGRAAARASATSCRRCASLQCRRAPTRRAHGAGRRCACSPSASPRSPRPDYRAYQQRLTDYNCALAASCTTRTTPAQRQHGARAS